MNCCKRTLCLIRLLFSDLKSFAQKIRVFLSLLIIFGCTSSSYHEEVATRQIDVKEFLSSLPWDERFLLEFFFRCLIQEDAIGYTLLGGKPMSIYSYLKPKPMMSSYHSKPLDWLDRLDLFFEGFDHEDALFHKGLETWKKYEHFFCGKNIFFNLFEHDHELHIMQVSVLNKRLMFPLFDRYFHKFIKLDGTINDKEFLFNLLLHDQKFKEKFYAREDLLGICLGYGEKNAELFRKMATLLTSMGRLGFTLEKPSPDRLKSLEGELAALEGIFKVGMRDHVSRKFLFNIGLGFRVHVSDPETSFLREKYTKLYQKLAQTYQSAAFLEKTLELIRAADNPEF
jgi:hypothetical protein